ncbi:hypothetical protein CL614_06885 [archaeon]|nr:hypothetical protein [archaeon]
MEGIKHTIECHCMLPQYKSSPDPVYHKFVVFSIIDNGDTVIPKYAQCNNCDVVHKVFDICKSEIVAGRDESKAIIKKDDVVPFIPEQITEILESYTADISSYEEAKFIMEHKKWGTFITLSKEILEEDIAGKRLIFEAENKFKIQDFIQKLYVE